MKKHICKNCQYFNRFGEEEAGRCHRFPPITITNNDTDNFGLVSYGNWCGEFKKN